MGSNKTISYPENYILLGSADAQKAFADVIISEIKNSHSEKFEGNRDSFSFELRYTAPFDKGFHELKRLQGIAAEAAGRRSDFKGYIVIDMNSWQTHYDEEYLNKALLFLIDMSEYWKYIFLVDNQNVKAARELVGKILSVFCRDNIPCMVKKMNNKSSYKEHIAALCKSRGVMCSTQVKEFFEELLEHKFSEDIVMVLLSEMFWKSGRTINMTTLVNLMDDHDTTVRYMLTQREYDHFLALVEKRKENWHGEKEAV